MKMIIITSGDLFRGGGGRVIPIRLFSHRWTSETGGVFPGSIEFTCSKGETTLQTLMHKVTKA